MNGTRNRTMATADLAVRDTRPTRQRLIAVLARGRCSIDAGGVRLSGGQMQRAAIARAAIRAVTVRRMSTR